MKKERNNIIESTEGYVIQTDYGFIHVGDDWEYYISTSFSNGGLAMFGTKELARKVRDKIKKSVAWKGMIKWTKIVRVVNDNCFCKKEKPFNGICYECSQRKEWKKE